ncbi:MAG: ATP-binding protein [Chloroflexi bacterium]|nr:ATP-binding protein [Chloroflexota bacterium]
MSTLTPLLSACPPRPVSVAGDQYAAELIRGIREELATSERANEFLHSTHLTTTTLDLLRIVMDRMNHGQASTSSTIFQMYSRYGGGKTHGMLVLAAAALHPHLEYWEATAKITATGARVIAFNGENSNPTTGVPLDQQGHRAKSLSGYIIFQLGGPEALHGFREGDERLTDPGAEEFRRLIGDQPIIIMIDELVHYVNRIRQRVESGDRVSQEGTLSTISALAAAVSNSPRAVLLITSPEDAHELLSERTATSQGDAFTTDALALTEMLDRVNSQLARQIRPVVPSSEADLPAILRARLFRSIDEEARAQTSAAYAAVASRNSRTNGGFTELNLRECYPFHPSVMTLITGRLSANRNFQRVRGTLRLLGNTVLTLQRENDAATLIHPHHIDPGEPAIREELVNKIRFEALDPAIDTDVAGPGSTAARMDNPLAIQAARTMLIGTLAPDSVNGLYADQIADAILSPEQEDYGVVASAVQAFLNRAIHVDDNADSDRKRFSNEPNVMKQLIETRDSIRADTVNLEALLRRAIASAYSGGSRQNPNMQVTIFPNKASNVPDEPDQVCLGIINPEFFNWVDVQDGATGMSNNDLVDLYSHNMGNNGRDFRVNRNNVMFLVPQDRNLGRIRDDIATMEAADRLLKDPNQKLQEHRRATLESIRAESEKNATSGIQNKWNHLICPGASEAHRWPRAGSVLEHRPLSSTAEPVGNGQKQILDHLGDRILYGQGADISPAAWARVPILRREEGTTLRDLRSYFSSTPAERIVINSEAWLNLVRTGIANGGLHVETQSGEVNPPSDYDPGWLAWAAGFKPNKTEAEKPEDGEGQRIGEGNSKENYDPNRNNQERLRSMVSELTQAAVAAKSVEEFMASQGYGWDNLKSCTITSTTPEFADHVASIPQGVSEGVSISLMAYSAAFNLELRGMNPQVFKQFSSSARRMLQLAEVATADVTITTDGKGAQDILGKLTNAHTARIRAEFE